MHETSIELLNKALQDELSAVHQYMYFHFHCDDQGYDILANLFKRTAIDEMLHMEKIAERILFLKGAVKLEASEPVAVIHAVQAMLEKSAEMESGSVRDYNEWANACAAAADSQSKKLFEELVADEERHFDQWDTELENIKRFGVDYLALQSMERSRSRMTGPAQ